MMTFNHKAGKPGLRSFPLLIIVVPLVLNGLSACDSNSGNGEDAVALVAPSETETVSPDNSSTTTSTASTTSTTSTASTATPVPPLVSPVAASDVASLLNLPTLASAAAQLDVTVSGSTLIGYQYALVQDSTSCLGVTYSALKDISAKISDTLGGDGTKTLCVVALSKVGSSDPKASALSYSWLKDATAPTISFPALTGYGPAAQAGSTFALSLTASDEASDLGSAQFSLSDGTQCLNTGATAFNATCPNLIAATTVSPGNFRASAADSLFADAGTYVASVWVSDSVGNSQATPATLSFTWDASGPSNVSSLTLSVNQQDVSLSWPAVTGAATYMVVRRQDIAVSATPAAGDLAAVGSYLGNGNFLACQSTGTSCVDANLDPYTLYHYQVIAFDTALNRSASGPRASIRTLTQPVFQGLSRVYLINPMRTIGADWQKFTGAGQLASSITYGLFANDTPNTENYVTAASTVINSDVISYTDVSNADSLYFTAKQWGTDAIQDRNTRELRLKLNDGVHHKLGAVGRFMGQDPLSQTYLRSAWAVAFDPFGNLVFGGAQGTVNVICKESSLASYCKGRTLDKMYTFAGTDGTDDGPDGALASANAMGEPYGIAFDSYGNMFLADSTNFRVRVVCYAPNAPGACYGKIQGYSYHLAGTGSSVDGLDDAVSKTTGIGLPNGIAVDSVGNVYFSDSTFRKVRLICFDLSQSPCSGKVQGNIYNLIGTGVAGDAADNLPALAANLGSLGALTIDTRGNIFFSDTTNARVRVYCRAVTGSNHFCASKTAGNLYRVTGTGVAGDGANDVAASTAQIATINGIAVSAHDNVYLADNSVAGNRLRALCYNTTSDYYCLNQTAGNTYRISGTGASTDGATGTLAVAISIGSPRGLALDAAENMVWADPTNKRIRLHCVTSQTGGFCDGKLPDYHYHVAGAGVSSLGWNLDAFLTPMGLPQGLAEDSHGNLYLSDATNFVARVICYEVISNGFCKNKTQGVSYIIAGNGVTGNAADNVLAIANSIGTITGMEVDAQGNLLLADNTNRTIRLVCGTTTGACVGKSVGYMYRYIGNTTAADTADAAVASSSGMGQPADLALDVQGNVWIADAQYFRIRLFCITTTGNCTGKTAGNIYRWSGTGITGNAADAVTASTAALGTLNAIDVDRWNNVLIGDASNFYVRVLCNNATGGYCAGKATPSGKIYRAIGTGVTGDALNDTSAAGSAISAMNAVQADSAGNIYLAESTNRRIRILCVDTTAGYCLGLTSGNTYRLFGSSVAGDASSGTAGSVARIDTPSRDSLLFTAQGGHLIYVGGGTPATLGTIRIFLSY